MPAIKQDLHSHAHIGLKEGAIYLSNIVDRLKSYDPDYDENLGTHSFNYHFGKISLEQKDDGYAVRLQADGEVGLHRIKDIAATAIKLYTKTEAPEIIWQGDFSGEQALPQFRLMRVEHSRLLTPHMLRLRLKGDDLERFSLFGSMHVRLLLPTSEVPQPVWPVMGSNGLPLWLNEAKRPAPRAYTIRNLNVAEGWMEIDFYLHEIKGLASQWALDAQPGDQLGLMGPVGRPLRPARNYLIGTDSTGLPAVGRMLEEFDHDVRGQVIIAVESEEDVQPLKHPQGVNVEWIIEADGDLAASKLTQKLCACTWPEGEGAFGWFAGESSQAKIIRKYWRQELGKTRDESLVAGYWQKDTTGFMAG